MGQAGVLGGDGAYAAPVQRPRHQGEALGEARRDHHCVRGAEHATGAREISGHRRPQHEQSRRLGIVQRAARSRRQRTGGHCRPRPFGETNRDREFPAVARSPARPPSTVVAASASRRIMEHRCDPGARAGCRHQPPLGHQLRVRLHHRASGQAQVGWPGSGSPAGATRRAAGRPECSPVARSPAATRGSSASGRTPDAGQVTSSLGNDPIRVSDAGRFDDSCAGPIDFDVRAVDEPRVVRWLCAGADGHRWNWASFCGLRMINTRSIPAGEASMVTRATVVPGRETRIAAWPLDSTISGERSRPNFRISPRM